MSRYLPAFPELLEGWNGMAILLGKGEHDTIDIREGVPWMRGGGFWNAEPLEDSAWPRIHLDTHRPEVHAHLLHWLHSQGKPAHHLRPVWMGGSLTNEEAGAALAWSVQSVRAGGEVLKAVLTYLPRQVRRERLAEGYATREADGTITFPPLPNP